MRLRQLGMTQSVVFFAPPEVHQSVLDVCRKKPGQHIDSADVIRWLLEQTCRFNEQLQSLYIAQGSDFCVRTNAAWEYPNFLSDKTHRASLLGVIKCQERLTLDNLYGARTSGPADNLAHISYPLISNIVEELTHQRQAARHLSLLQNSAMEEVEQEREVEFQLEEVRQVQAPTHFDALRFPGLHPAIRRFADTGLLSGTDGYEGLFSALARTNLGRKHGLSDAGSKVFVSAEFMRTVEFCGAGPDDNFLVGFLSY